MNGRTSNLCVSVSLWLFCDRTTEAQRHRKEFKELDHYEQ
jgi:hypothetical protein